MKHHRAYAPDKPFLMYWAPGAAHGPHHIFKEWADKYKGTVRRRLGRMRERSLRGRRQLGWIPADTKLTPRADTMAAWDSIPEAERPFQRRLMEVFAGFVEHTDAQVGKLIDGLERSASARTPSSSTSGATTGRAPKVRTAASASCSPRTRFPNTIQQQIDALNKIGGLEALGGPKVDNMYHAGWAWAGEHAVPSTKLVAAHFGGTRNPMVVSWPKGIKPTRRRARSSTTSTTSCRRSTR